MSRRATIVGAALLAASMAATVAWSRGGGAPVPVVAIAPTTTAAVPTTSTTAPARAAEAADPVGDRVDLFAAAGDAAPIDTLTNPTNEGMPLVMLVRERGPVGWLRVQYPKRPNEATAWVKSDQVTTRGVDDRIVVSVSGRLVTLYKGATDQVLLQAPVAVGTDRTPTPLGRFYVDIVVDLITKTGPYGSYQISVAGFSDVLQSFGGGVGQIAIHGTNQPDLIGGKVSNGCIRMRNEDISALVPLIRTGTPVDVVA